MPDALSNIAVLGQERIERVRDLQGQNTRPLFNWVMKQAKTVLDDFGLRITLYLTEPGGDTAFTYSDPSFRTPIVPIDDAMRVYPARTAKAINMNGDMLRGLKANRENWLIKYQEYIDRTANSHKKLLSRWFHGDGTGTLAVATTTNGTGPVIGTTSSGGTSAQGVTKGTAYLQQGEKYDCINPATGLVRGTFTVATEGKTSVTVVGAAFDSGTQAAGDYVVVSGTYNKVPIGLRHLANFSNRVLQNFNTADNARINTPYYDANGNAVSPSAFSYAKGLVQTFNNDEGEEKGKMCIMTFGHQKTLVNQAFQYRQYTNPKGDETVYGVPSKYVDMDGDIHFVDADAPDEQIRILDANNYKVGEDMPFGPYNDDGLEWRMYPGSNNVGADRFFRGIGWQGQLYKAGIAGCDAVIDDVAHSGSDYITQTS